MLERFEFNQIALGGFEGRHRFINGNAERLAERSSVGHRCRLDRIEIDWFVLRGDFDCKFGCVVQRIDLDRFNSGDDHGWRGFWRQKGFDQFVLRGQVNG